MIIRFLAVYCLLGFYAAAQAQSVVVTSPPPDTLACEIFRDRGDWYEAARRTETRWGMPAAHQLALFAEDWSLSKENLPSKWRRFLLSDRPDPGLPAGYFETTWRQYIADTGNKGASTDRFADVSDFMGWYFAGTATRTGLSPYDSRGQYIVWRYGPDAFLQGQWQSNIWQSQQANAFANRASVFSQDLIDCTVELDTTWASRLSSIMSPWTWRDGKPGQAGHEWISSR